MHKKTLFSRAGRLAVAVSGALTLAGAALPANASTLRIAMTAADIPLTLGQPDQGYEGNRFTGIPLYDALVEWDLSQGEKPSGLVPGLATEWHIDPQNTSRWIFTLRPGVRFHDGTEVNADAIVWNVDKVLNKAAPQYAPGQIGNTLSRMPTLTGAEKIDDHTVALTTSEPDALLPYNITNLFIVSPTAWQKQYDAVPASAGDSAARSKQAWTAFAAHAVGSGPFKLEKLVPRQQLILDKNPDYWNKDRIPRVDKVVLIPCRRPTPVPRRCCRSRWTGLKPRRRTPSIRSSLRVFTSTPIPSRTCGPGSSPLKKDRRGRTSACAKRPTCV